MTGAAKAKGDRAERECADLLTDLTGFTVRRMLGAGRTDDVGDLDGIPRTVVQVANWSDVLRAIREKPIAAEQQRLNAQADHAVTLLRLWGGDFRAVLTPEQWAHTITEALR